MGYYTKADADRGPIGAWMRYERLARDWSIADVGRGLEAIGEHATAATLRQYEAGPRQPGAQLLAALVCLYGSEPHPDRDARTDIDRLADATNRLAAALEHRRGS